MWPRDRKAGAECLRIGRHAVERWTSVDGVLTLQAKHALPQGFAPRPQDLADAIGALHPGSAAMPTTLLLESAWLPVMLVDTGAGMLRKSQLDALVRHRFGLHHSLQGSDGFDPVATWELRIEHRPGNRYALAYGLAPSVKQSLMAAARTSRLDFAAAFAAISPALGWGLARFRPSKRWPRSTGWWLWPEQDRTLVAQVSSGEVVGLNAGAPRVVDEPSLLRLVEAESARLGVGPSIDPIAAATWDSAPRTARTNARLAWLDIRDSDGRASA